MQQRLQSQGAKAAKTLLTVQTVVGSTIHPTAPQCVVVVIAFLSACTSVSVWPEPETTPPPPTPHSTGFMGKLSSNTYSTVHSAD